MAPSRKDMYKIALTIAEAKLRQAEEALRIARKDKTKSAIPDLEQAVKDAQKNLNDLKNSSGEERQAAIDAVMTEVYDEFGGYIEELLNRVPEMAALLTEAVEGRWDADRFLRRFYQTDWWKEQVESGKERSWFQAFQAEYGGFGEGPDWNSLIAESKIKLREAFRRFGGDFDALSDEQQYALARKYQYENWERDANELQENVIRVVQGRSTEGNPRPGQFQLNVDPGTPFGNIITMLKNRAAEFGLDPSVEDLRQWATQLQNNAASEPVTQTQIDEILTRRAQRKYGLTDGDIGFGPENEVFDDKGNPIARSLKEATLAAIDAGGEAARRLLSNQSLLPYLDIWRDESGMTFRERLNQKLAPDRETVVALARGMDLRLSDAEIDYWTREYKYNNWSQQQLSQALYSRQQSGVSPVPEDPTAPGEGAPPVGDTEGGGRRESLADDVRNLLRDYGIYDLGDAWVMSYVERMVNPDPMQSLTIDDVRNIVVDLAKERYGPLGDRIDSTRSTRTAATNYLGRMASLLELDADSIELNDPLLEKYLTEPNPDTPLNLADFSKAVRSDKRWQFTGNARDTYMDAVQGFLSRMGFTG